MNNTHIENNDDEIDLKTVVDFLKRQLNILVATFTVTLLVTLTYALSMPTLYQSKVSVLIGEKMYFLQQQQQNLIENIEELKYTNVDLTINAIKNTRFVEVSAIGDSVEISQIKLKQAIENITNKHNELLTKKRAEFAELLKVVASTGTNTNELINLLDNASNSNKTKTTSSLSTTTLRYSGRFTQIVGVGFIVALSLALFFGLIKDLIEKHYRRLSATISDNKLT